MRINLQCPFSEKDRAKALGARWDSGKRVWYLIDPEDLTPFMRWIKRDDPKQVDAPAHAINPENVDLITLTQYLSEKYRGCAKSLSFHAAKAFGVPYPLKSGWADRYAHHTALSTVLQHEKRKKKTKKTAIATSASPKKSQNSLAPVRTTSAPAYDCGCDHILPWDDCEHTDAAAAAAMREMLQ